MMDDQAPHGANQAIKEAVKWEIEVVERKTEERFREIENLIKKVGAKMDKTASQLQEDTNNEFQNLKLQFEEFGNSIYEKINQEVQEKIGYELGKSLIVLQESLNTDFSTSLSEATRPLDVKVLALESQCEEIRMAQVQALEELTKYQDNIESMINQNEGQINERVEAINSEFQKHKVSSLYAIENTLNEFAKKSDLTDFITLRDFTDKIRQLQTQINSLPAKEATIKSTSNDNQVSSKELQELERILREEMERLNENMQI